MTHPKFSILSLIWLCFHSAIGQVEVNKRIELTGSGSDAKIEGVDEVIHDHDAVNKIYVDTAIANRAAQAIPLMTILQRDAISNPFVGQQIFNTDCGNFNFYYNGNWINNPAIPLNQSTGPISGNASPLQGATGVTYSIPPVSGASSYIWTVPPGATIVSGQGTPSITVNFGYASGNLCVIAENPCGDDGSSCLAVNLVWQCGLPLYVTHVAGNISPESATIGYGTVQSSISGSSKCWITQNLGASSQGSSVTDNSVSSRGWFWQFNRNQGYKNINGNDVSPAWTITTISEGPDWITAEDPCNLLLGTGWRIPTDGEMSSIINNLSPNSDAGAFSSVLKLHLAGYLNTTNGVLTGSGTEGRFWSKNSYSDTQAYSLVMSTGGGALSKSPLDKALGRNVRCMKD